MLRRTVISLLLAGMLAIASVGSAFAHECVISSRSAQGDQGATNSKVWDKLYLSTILGAFLGLTEDQVAWALDHRGDLPEYWVTRMDKTIGEGSSNPNLASGKGMDYLVPLVGPQIFGLAAAAQEAVPAP
jgi:hypothetical protein